MVIEITYKILGRKSLVVGLRIKKKKIWIQSTIRRRIPSMLRAIECCLKSSRRDDGMYAWWAVRRDYRGRSSTDWIRFGHLGSSVYYFSNSQMPQRVHLKRLRFAAYVLKSIAVCVTTLTYANSKYLSSLSSHWFEHIVKVDEIDSPTILSQIGMC